MYNMKSRSSTLHIQKPRPQHLSSSCKVPSKSNVVWCSPPPVSPRSRPQDIQEVFRPSSVGLKTLLDRERLNTQGDAVFRPSIGCQRLPPIGSHRPRSQGLSAPTPPLYAQNGCECVGCNWLRAEKARRSHLPSPSPSLAGVHPPLPPTPDSEFIYSTRSQQVKPRNCVDTSSSGSTRSIQQEAYDEDNENKYISLAQYRSKSTARKHGAFSRTPKELLDKRPMFGSPPCNCEQMNCGSCSYRRSRGDTLQYKLGWRAMHPKMLNLKVYGCGKYTEDGRRLLTMQAAYIQGYELSTNPKFSEDNRCRV